MTIEKTMVGTRPQLLLTDSLPGSKPTIIYFSPGMGENASDGSFTNLDLLYKNGSPFQLAKDGKLSNYVVVCLQGSGGPSANVWEVFAAMKSVMAKYGTNGVRPMTGLSMGAQNTLDVAGNDVEGIFTAFVEMSTPGTSVTDWSKFNRRLLAFHGDMDGNQTPYSRSVDAVKAINAAHAGSAFLITKPQEGHSGWDFNYDTANRFDIPGYGKMNWLEWATDASLNPTKVFTATGTTATLPTGGTTQPTMATVKAKVTINADKTATLDSSASTGLGAFDWTITPPLGAAKPYFKEGRSDGGKDLAIRTAVGITPGSWTFKLTGYPVAGGSISDAVTIDVPVPGTVTPPPVVVTPPVVTPPPVVLPPETLIGTYNFYSTGRVERI